MKLLLDECVPRRLRQEFAGHEVFSIEYAGFKGLKNGVLLRRAADEGFEALITVDKGIEYQQNPNNLPIPVLILSARSNRYETLAALIPKAISALSKARKGELLKIEE